MMRTVENGQRRTTLLERGALHISLNEAKAAYAKGEKIW